MPWHHCPLPCSGPACVGSSCHRHGLSRSLTHLRSLLLSAAAARHRRRLAALRLRLELRRAAADARAAAGLHAAGLLHRRPLPTRRRAAAAAVPLVCAGPRAFGLVQCAAAAVLDAIHPPRPAVVAVLAVPARTLGGCSDALMPRRLLIDAPTARPRRSYPDPRLIDPPTAAMPKTPADRPTTTAASSSRHCRSPHRPARHISVERLAQGAQAVGAAATRGPQGRGAAQKLWRARGDRVVRQRAADAAGGGGAVPPADDRRAEARRASDLCCPVKRKPH
eukprot:924220-Prymnesium_polylepis.1